MSLNFSKAFSVPLSVIIFFFLNLGFSQNTDALLFKKAKSEVYKNKLLIDTLEVYNTQTDYDDFMKGEAMPNSECNANYSSYYNPLSLVGALYSYEWGYFEEAACGPSGNSLGVNTISLSTNKKVSILEIVEEKDIVAAFKTDDWVQRIYKDATSTINDFETLQEFIDFFSRDLMGPRFTTSSFCVLGFTEGIVKIRFVGSEYMGYDHNQYLQLGFELAVKKDALQLFMESDNFYLGKFENRLTK